MLSKDKKNKKNSIQKVDQKGSTSHSHSSDIIINPIYFFISGFSSAATIGWAIIWLAFSLFIDYELLTEAITSDLSSFIPLTFAPIGLMFYVQRKIRSYPQNSKSDSFGQVLLILGRLMGAFTIYIIIKIMYFPIIFPVKVLD